VNDRPTRVPVRDDLADLQPYGAPQFDVAVRLNTNETAEPPPAAYLDEVRRRLAGLELNRYPDRRSTQLREAIAAQTGLTADRVWAANGSNEVLHQLLLAYGGPDRKLVGFRPGYAMYPILARVTMTPFHEVELGDDLRVGPAAVAHAVGSRPDMLILANPNNPTGMTVDARTIRALHDGTSGLVVVDEAYVEFGGESVLPLLDELPRLVVVRTFSKAFRLAGLRLGYLLAHDWVVDDIRRVRLPYHLDAMKQVAAVTALEMRDQFLEHRARVAIERDRIIACLQAQAGAQPFPSSANFVLFRVAQATEVFQGLLDRGVLIRDFSDKPKLQGCLRVTVGTADENDAFLAALAEVLGAPLVGHRP